MYKLLLVTDKPEVQAAFDAVEGWERLGFRLPRKAACVEEALEVLTRHHADAIAIGLAAAEEERLIASLDQQYPLMPIMRAAADADTVARDASELEQLLGRINADYSNDRYDRSEKLLILRHSYFRRILSGSEPDPQRIRRYLRLLRSRMDPAAPCVVLELKLPEDGGGINTYWQYGADRLEVALRNLFGSELQGMRILTSVLPDERIYLVCCPMRGHTAPEREEMFRLAEDYAMAGIRHVREYLKMDLSICGRMLMPNLTELGRHQARESEGMARAQQSAD